MTAKIFDTIAQSLVNSIPDIWENEQHIESLKQEASERLQQAEALQSSVRAELLSAVVLCDALNQAGVMWEDYEGLSEFCRTAPLRAGEGLAVDYIQPGRTDRT